MKVYGTLLLAAVASATTVRAETIEVGDAPFAMPAMTLPDLPAADFPITDYGARPDGTKCTAAFEAAFAACEKAGGGRVVVPDGTWFVGNIRFRSNCELHLADGAVLDLSDDPNDYPKVHTTWEGVECLNHSPLVFAYGCENVALTGRGLIRPRMAFWRTWFARPPAHMKATELLYHWCSTNAPMASRDLLAIKGSNVRPHLIQFNRCRNVRIEDVRIRESPFWVIHLYLSENCLLRGLDVSAHGHNNDGLDVDMTRNVLVEDCRFDEGDDGIVLKAGRNQDAWRLNRPTENVVIRNCDLSRSHSLLGIGSELSSGIRNVWMHHCTVDASGGMIRVKTNRRRGGFVENVYMDHCTAGQMKWVFNIETDILFQWGKFPDYEIRYTRLRNFNLSDCTCDCVHKAVLIHGDRHLKPSGITLRNVRINHVFEKFADIDNCEDLRLENVTLAKEDGELRPYGAALPVSDWIRDLSDRHRKVAEFVESPAFGTLPPGRYPVDGDDAWVEVKEDSLVPCDQAKFETDGAFDTLIVGPDRAFERCWAGKYQKEYTCSAGSFVFVPAGSAFAPRLVYDNAKPAIRRVAKIRRIR